MAKEIARDNAQAALVDAARNIVGSYPELGALLGVHRNTVENWRKGTYMPRSAKIICKMLQDRTAREIVLITAATEPRSPW